MTVNPEVTPKRQNGGYLRIGHDTPGTRFREQMTGQEAGWQWNQINQIGDRPDMTPPAFSRGSRTTRSVTDHGVLVTDRKWYFGKREESHQK